jgi:lipid-binding SYLF domain-containing protein
MKNLACAAAVVLAAAATLHAAIDSASARRLESAAQVLREARGTISAGYFDRARCVAVVPDLKKAAFIFGGEYGKGVLSCRAGEGWSAPLFLQLAKGSWGFQAGAEEVDLVLLVMNESGVQKLMKNKVALGADASIAAGPVGRQANIGTDGTLTAEILAYSRAKGLFAGVNLSGGVLRPDDDANRDAYGPGAAPEMILASRSLSAPTEATPFIQALGTSGASAAAAPTAAPVPSAPAVSVPQAADSDLRTELVAMQQVIERMLADGNSTPVGTSGADRAAAVSVSREQLEQLRNRIEAIIASLNRR